MDEPCDLAFPEKVIIGCCLLSADEYLARCADLLDPSDFADPHCGRVFKAMLELRQAGHPVEPVAVNVHDPTTDCYEMSKLMDWVHHVVDVEYYANAILSASESRQLSRLHHELQQMSAANDMTPNAIHEKYREGFNKVTDRKKKSKNSSIGDVLDRVLDAIDAKQAAGGGITGLTTGFHDLDELTDGWHEGELIIVAAPPSMGKSALALHFAITAAKCGKEVYFFSLEMSDSELMRRAVCTESMVPQDVGRKARFNEFHWRKIGNTFNWMRALPILINDSSGQTVASMANSVERDSSLKGVKPGMIVVDYIGLAESGQKTENRANEMGAITKGLKAMAKNLKCPVVALAQLNRDSRKEKNHRPQLHHLRDSGRIEEDADIVLLLHRQDYFDKRDGVQNGEHAGKAEIIVAKQRNGPIGDIHVLFNDKFVRFSDAVRPHQEAEADRLPYKDDEEQMP